MKRVAIDIDEVLVSFVKTYGKVPWIQNADHPKVPVRL